jgi:hypothetical protein
MAAWQRFAILIAVTIANAIAGIIYYRVGVAELFPMATGASSGPFTPAVTTLETLVPIVIAVIQLGVVVWVVVGGVQKERSRVRGPR